MSSASASLVYVDPSRTYWYDRFFSTWEIANPDELLEAIDALSVSVEAVAKSDDLARRGLSGWLYWTLYIKGFLENRNRNSLDESNTYLAYLYQFGCIHKHDPGLAEAFDDLEKAKQRVNLRFEDFRVIEGLRNGGGDDGRVGAISCRVLPQDRVDTKELHIVGSGEPIAASDLDGYHRLFLARLFELERLPCLVSYDASRS